MFWLGLVIGGGLLLALADGHPAPGQAAEVTAQPAARAVSDANWRIALVAGNGQTGDLPADAASRASDLPVELPFGVEVGPDGHLYIASVGQHRVLQLDLATGQLRSVAGIGRPGYRGDGGPATLAELNEPYELRFDAYGHLLIVEMQNHLVRRFDAATGNISTLAGTGVAGFGGDGGPALQAQFQNPHSLALDGQGRLYVADIGNHRIRVIDPATGNIDTLAGTGAAELPTDGGACRNQPVLGPRALFCQGDTLWVALREGHSVWSLDLKSETWHHVAGSGQAGYEGDGGPALEATFNGPKGIVATPDGLVYVVDTENDALREVDPLRGTIRSIAGGRTLVGKLRRPHGVGFRLNGALGGELFVGDSENHRVWKLTAVPANE